MSNFCTKSVVPRSLPVAPFAPPAELPSRPPSLRIRRKNPAAQIPAAPDPYAAPQPAAAPYVPYPAAQVSPAYVPIPMQPVPVQTTSGGGAQDHPHRRRRLRISRILAASVVGFIGWRVAKRRSPQQTTETLTSTPPMAPSPPAPTPPSAIRPRRRHLPRSDQRQGSS